MKKKTRKKLKKIGETALAALIAIPICAGMIACAFGIFIALGVAVIIIMVVVVPIAIIINAITDLTNHSTKTVITYKEEDMDNEKYEIGVEKDL